MLDELPELARRIKVFVRENPRKEVRSGIRDEDALRAGLAGWTGEILAAAAKASRKRVNKPVENESLSLAALRSYENRTNSAPLSMWPGSGVGLVRVCGFGMGADFAGRQRTLALLEYSPLGWPDLPDMAEADLNVLFEEKGAAVDVPLGVVSAEQLRREWGFA